MVKAAWIACVCAVVICANGLACTSAMPSAEPAAAHQAELINGAPAPGDYLGALRVSADAECSGFLITNQWAVTARHCISSVLADHPEQIAVSFGGTRAAPTQTSTVAEVVRSPPGPDLAMLRLTVPLTVGGATYGFFQRPYPSYSNFAQGRSLSCVGWGSTGAVNPPTDVPSFAFLTLDTTTPPFLGLGASTNGQEVAVGDAGGLCSIYLGAQPPIGVMAGLFTDGGKDSSVAIDLTQLGVRSWMESTLLQQDPEIPANAASTPHAVSPDGQLIDLFWIDDAGRMNGIEISPDAPPSSYGPPQIIGGSRDDPFAPARPGAAYAGTDLHVLGRTASGQVLEGVSSNGVAAVMAWTPVALLPAIGSGLGIAVQSGDRFDLLARSAAGPVAHAWFQGGAWASGELIGGSLDKDVLGSWDVDPNRGPVLQLFGVSQTFVMRKDGYPDGWSPPGTDWSNGDVNGNISSACSVVSSGGSTLDLFARGASGHLVHKSFVVGWVDGFLDLGLPIPDEPSAVIAGARIHVFARNPDGSIWHAHLPR